MPKILVLKLGSTFSSLGRDRGDFEDWVIEKAELAKDFFQIHNSVAESNIPNANNFAGVILTGSHDMVTDNHDWSEKAAEWLAKSAIGKIPVLGICYGHQLLAHALDGEVADNSDGMEIGTVQLHSLSAAKSDKLFQGLNFPFPVFMSHSQSVSKIPSGAVPLAATDRTHIAAFFVPPAVWGVQFHPEFDGHIVRRYVQRSAEKLLRENQSPEKILSKIQETPEATHVLQRFCRLCL